MKGIIINNNNNNSNNNANNNCNNTGQSNYCGPINSTNAIHLTDYNSSSSMKVPFSNHPYLHHHQAHHTISQSPINRLSSQQSMTSDSPSLYQSHNNNHSLQSTITNSNTVTILTSSLSSNQPIVTSSSSSLSSLTGNPTATVTTTGTAQGSSYYLNNLTSLQGSGSTVNNANLHADVYPVNNLSHQPQHFATLSYPRRVRVLPSNTFTIRSTDDIDSHHHTDV